MKKLLLSMATIGVVGAAGYLGYTGAFFSDTESSLDNTFVAGDIDLQIGNASYVLDYNIPNYSTPSGALVANASTSWGIRDLTAERFFNFVDLKPGDEGADLISVRVGSNDAWVCAAAQVTADNDNTYTEPEEDDDLTVEVDPTTTDGELDDEVNFAFWVDDGDNVYEAGEPTPFLMGPLSALGDAGQMAIADADSSILGEDVPVPGNTAFSIGKAWCFGAMTPQAVDDGLEGDPTTRGTGFNCDGDAVNNAAQTDELMIDLQFYAEQSRNNPDFSCTTNWTPTWPTPTVTPAPTDVQS